MKKSFWIHFVKSNFSIEVPLQVVSKDLPPAFSISKSNNVAHNLIWDPLYATSGPSISALQMCELSLGEGAQFSLFSDFLEM